MHLARCGKRTEVMSVSNLRQSDYVDNIWRSQHAVIIVMCENMQEFQKWVRGHAPIRSRRFYSISIGSVCRNGSITNSESSFTGVCTVQPYLAAELQRVADLESRRRLRSASSPALVIPATRRCTLGDRAFSSAAPRVWNRLPSTVTESPSLAVLKTHLFTARDRTENHDIAP